MVEPSRQDSTAAYDRYRVVPAMSTPLASIFGSGFLVVVVVPVRATDAMRGGLFGCRNTYERTRSIGIGFVLAFVQIFAVPAG